LKRYGCLLLIALLAGCNRGRPEPVILEPDRHEEAPEEKPPQRVAISPEAPFTFAVVGDNRGESSGRPVPAFTAIVRAMRETSPDLVFNTGDIINGYKGEKEAHLRKLWRGYKESIVSLKRPVYHVPGNHDIFDPASARVWKETWGETWFSFDHGCARFIGLDTESDRSRVRGAQLDWLRKQLASCRLPHVFVFLHKPLFPVDGHIGSSLDEFPAERDRLHHLFVEHRGRIKGVFQGHEHLYHFSERDGVPYFIIAGGGAPLYVPPELGGFYHFLLARVSPDRVRFEVKRPGRQAQPSRQVVEIQPGELLEGWENALFWSTWDQTVGKEITASHASEGRQGLKVTFDLAMYEWPVLLLMLHPHRDLSRIDRLLIDVYVPEALGGKVSANLSVKGKKSHEAPATSLKSGWNTVAADLNGGWLPAAERREARELQWTLVGKDRSLAAWVVFDNLRAEGKQGGKPRGASKPLEPGLLEGWEGKLLWGVWNESVRQEESIQHVTEGKRGLKVSFDLTRFGQPMLYAPLPRSWDLRKVRRLSVDVYLPPEARELALGLTLVHQGNRHRAPAAALKPGWNKVSVDLASPWLPEKARAAVEQVEWGLTSAKKHKGWVVLDNFRAAK
jgi:hypothetical protein